jgi:hypothetical protein
MRALPRRPVLLLVALASLGAAIASETAVARQSGCDAERACASSLRAYIGRFAAGQGQFIPFGRPGAFKPPQLHPFSADDNAWLYRLRWSDWGKGTARGRGRGAANNCTPNCAEGKFVRRRGARVRAWRLRAGLCHGREARFYTRARLYFPRGLGLGPFTVRLKTGCGRS